MVSWVVGIQIRKFFRLSGRMALMVWLSLIGCTAQQISGRETFEPAFLNPLAFSGSAYLRSFATTPVYWYPWDEAALEEAERNGKLLAIDIGTTACYPCQLQERLVYQDSAVVEVMNDRFVSIRIDRFERPDLAGRYLSLLGATGGGWPLQVIALPDGRPISVGNFLTPEKWLFELNRQIAAWEENPILVEQKASDNWNQIRDQLSPPQAPFGQSVTANEFLALYRNALDPVHGGRPGVPKFPVMLPYQVLAMAGSMAGEEWPMQQIESYLTILANGAVYDQIGGGIFRCAEDEQWRYPCFEKTLYDNAMLLRLLATLHRQRPAQRWVDMMYEIRNFLDRDLRLSGFQYAAALRPDSEGELGRYYLWPEIEVRAALDDKADPFIRTYNIRRGGNWGRGQNVLYRTMSDRDLAAGYGLEQVDWATRLEEWEEKLLLAREQRVRPDQDRMQIAGWQGLLITSLVECYRVTSDKSWLTRALQTADGLHRRLLRSDGSLYHFIGESGLVGDAFLADYAYVLEAFFSLYQVTLERVWMDSGMEMIRYLLAYHFQPQDGWFISEPPANRDWLRQYDLEDGALPSGQAILAAQLLEASWLMGKPGYREMARRQLAAMSSRMVDLPLRTSSWALLKLRFDQQTIVVSVAGQEAREWFQEVHRVLPESVLLREMPQTRNLAGPGARMRIQVGLEDPRDFESIREADTYLRRRLGLL